MKAGRPRLAYPTDRDLQWIDLFRSGQTLHEIGVQYGVTRERVRQRLALNGIRSQQGGASVRKDQRAAAFKVQRDRRCLSRYGLTYAELKTVPSGLRTAFISQRRSAACRGIGWMLSLADWLRIWRESGKLAERGRGRNGYCMARRDDRGGYTVSNVYITTGAENGADYQRAVSEGRKPRTKAAVGIYCLYPGMPKAWVAQYGRKKLGYFATAEEAIAAREAHLKNFPPKSPRRPSRSGFQSAPRRTRVLSDDSGADRQILGKAV